MKIWLRQLSYLVEFVLERFACDVSYVTRGDVWTIVRDDSSVLEIIKLVAWRVPVIVNRRNSCIWYNDNGTKNSRTATWCIVYDVDMWLNKLFSRLTNGII